VFATLKDHDKHDVYSLCAAGWIMYHQSRESRDMSSKGLEERRRGFQRSAEFYEKALQLDSFCAVAAQGLAIVTAEDALGSLSSGVPVSGTEEAQRRFKNAREALEVFAKVRESVNDGSVYLNMGHCHYACEEFDRAIESVRYHHYQCIRPLRKVDREHSTKQPPRGFTVVITSLYFCVCVDHGSLRPTKISPSWR
jgi:RNA polymerase-associated protein CTR9